MNYELFGKLLREEIKDNYYSWDMFVEVTNSKEFYNILKVLSYFDIKYSNGEDLLNITNKQRNLFINFSSGDYKNSIYLNIDLNDLVHNKDCPNWCIYFTKSINLETYERLNSINCKTAIKKLIKIRKELRLRKNDR